MCPYYGIMPPTRRNGHTRWGSDVQNVPQVAMRPFMNRSYTITADLIVPADGAEGGIIAAFDACMSKTGS